MYIRTLAASFFLVISALVSGQNSRKGFLILYRHLNPSTHLIVTGDNIWYKTDSLSPYKGITITGISGDTIFFKEGFVNCRKLFMIKTSQIDIFKEYELSNWKAAIPPREVYGSPEMLHRFRSWIIHNTSADGTFDEEKWYRSKHYRTGTLIDLKKNRQQKEFISHMDTIHKNFFKFDLTRFVCFQATYAYEFRFSSRYALEIEGGYQCRNDKPERPQTDPVPLLALEGPIIAVGPKYYYLSQKRPYYYFQPQFLFKYVYFTHQWDLKEVTHGEAEFQDQYRDVIGLSINFGAMKSFGPFFIDFTYGLGIKYAYVTQKLYYHASVPTADPKNYRYYNSSHTPEYRNSEEWNPILNLLIKIGVAF